MKKKVRRAKPVHAKSVESKSKDTPYFVFFVFVCVILILAIFTVVKPAMY